MGGWVWNICRFNMYGVIVISIKLLPPEFYSTVLYQFPSHSSQLTRHSLGTKLTKDYIELKI